MDYNERSDNRSDNRYEERSSYTEEDRTKEFGLAGPGGLSLRAKGYRLMDILGLGAFILMMATTYLVWEHKAQAGEEAKGMAGALKDANRTLAEALRETTRDTNAAIKEMAAEQRRMTEVIRENNCLMALPLEKRSGSAAELCRRMARDR